jgi:hypothetical protein
MLRNRVLTSSLIIGLAAFAANHAANAADPVFCANYASEAVKSAQLAKHLKCGFQGPRWTKDQAPHMAWCVLMPPNVAQIGG